MLDNASALGVTRVASNYGLNTSGSAYPSSTPAVALNGGSNGGQFSYWDNVNNQTGGNAWGVWLFSHATVPFYVHLQWQVSTSVQYGVAPGYPGSHPDTSNAGVGISVGMCSDGTQAWGGTTHNNGADTKSNPVWVTGSVNGYSYVWPRCDSAGGSLYNGSRNAMMSVASATRVDTTSNPCRYRMTVAMDENNLFILTDNLGSFNGNNLFFFGQYAPASGVVAPVPYFCYNNSNPYVLATITNFGSIAPVSGSSALLDGGIAVPVPSVSGTVGIMQIDVAQVGVFFNANNSLYCPEGPSYGLSPNLTASLGSTPGAGNVGVGMYNEYPIMLYCTENSAATSNFGGLVGYSYAFLRGMPQGVPPGSTLNGATRLVVGPTVGAGANTYKLTIPWTASLGPMYAAWNRYGIEF